MPPFGSNGVMGPGKAWACPYAKRPGNQDHVCHQRAFDKISRLKGHLNRKPHAIENSCATCWTSFKNEMECKLHEQARECTAKPPPTKDLVTPEQRAQLSSRASNDSDSWYEIFKCLCPGVPRPHSPFVNVDHSAEVRAIQNHLPAEEMTWEAAMHDLPPSLQPVRQSIADYFRARQDEFVAMMLRPWKSPHFDNPQPRNRRLRTKPTPARHTAACDQPLADVGTSTTVAASAGTTGVMPTPLEPTWGNNPEAENYTPVTPEQTAFNQYRVGPLGEDTPVDSVVQDDYDLFTQAIYPGVDDLASRPAGTALEQWLPYQYELDQDLTGSCFPQEEHQR
ncbi:hypothetical protein X797_008536 [Metarhizium robertsii]|uniref:C2H2-type domain-containing protein n=2 Tax=Metarhizium robertsii TaxID=568076 RepID=E9F825_METRA|nr:uncharacterized protein MAA_08424 [Metarhizium robertsii ARSEF 23]EFY96117.1 hypothetical protein MAA_08424 [Metarhizium robertsii ARSEF 23]EXU98359.1 hypothetical protein X797_008536 [Metarhizium robertsii]